MNIKNLFIICVIAVSIILPSNSFAGTKLLYDGVEHNYTAQPITLMVNEKIIKSNVSPVIINDRTLVPVRAVFEELGAEILWIAETEEIFITIKDDIVLLKVNSNTANINGESKTMESPPKIINGSTMIPLRFVSEALNFDVGWDSSKRIASVNSIPEVIEIETEQSTENVTEKSTEQTNESLTQESTEKMTNHTIENTTEKVTNESTESTTEKATRESTESTTEKSTQNNANTNSQNGEIITIKGDTKYNYNNVENTPIQNENYPIVNLINIILPENGDETFKIHANGKISSVKYDIIQDPVRLYVDVENSLSKLNATISETSSGAVKAIRTAQKSDAQNVTRIVFDLSSFQSYSVYLSEDRTTLNIKFQPVVLEKITFQNVGDQDIINIYGNSSFITNVTKMSNPDRMVIDIPNTTSVIGNKTINVQGAFISEIRTSQFDASTARIAIDTTKLSDYEITNNNLYTTIKLFKPTYNNISYENSQSPKMTIKKDNIVNINTKSITHQDNYMDNNYKIILPGDYSEIYGYGNFRVNDTYLDFVNIQNINGKTEFTFNQKNVYAYTITEDEKNVYINIVNPKVVYKHVVVIDPGHGGSAPGTIQNGLTEKNITLDVGNRLYLLLNADPDIKVYTTRATDVNPSFDYRTGLANHLADMFVSVHCNSITSPSVRGTQVFYPNPNDSRGAMSKQLSDLLMEGVISNTGFPNRPANQSMGYAFKVLRETTVPACLVEMGFLTNASDASKLASPEGRQQVAQGVYEGIKKAFKTIIPNR